MPNDVRNIISYGSIMCDETIPPTGSYFLSSETQQALFSDLKMCIFWWNCLIAHSLTMTDYYNLQI